MKQIEIVARSAELAKAKVAEQLEVPIEDLHIIEEYEPDDQDMKDLEEVEKDLPESEKTGEPVLYVVRVSMKRAIGVIEEWVNGLLQHFQPGSECEVVPEENRLRVVIEADDPSIFIGKQGHTLAALQHIVTRIGPRLVPECPQLFLDVGDYRDRKAEQLDRMVRQAIQRAQRTGQSVALRPMPSTDRKYVHNLLKNREGIVTKSHGTEPRRHVVIEAAGGGRGGGNRRGGGGNRENGRGRGRGDQRETQPPLPPGVDASDMTAGGLKELRRREEIMRRQASPLVNVNKRQSEDLQIEEHGTRLPEWKPSEEAGPVHESDELVDELE